MTEAGEAGSRSRRDSRAGLRLVARTLRGERTESWHLGAAAARTPQGELVARVGDPSLSTYLRSAAKPFQAIAMLRAGLSGVGLDEADLALISASHGGRPRHIRLAEGLLDRAGLSPQDLRCGPHAPLDGEAGRELAAAGEEATPLHNNCSGKHAGMLWTAKLLEASLAAYTDPDHPLQRLILEEVEAFTGVSRGEIGLGIDGCGAPSFHLPLAGAALGYARLADPVGLAEPRREAVRRVVAAMTNAPDMVAGPGRFTTRLIEVTGGRVLGKEGAAGFYAAAVRGPVALGVALKVADGSETCRDGVVLELLRQLGILSAREFEALAEFRTPKLRNHGGTEVGRVEPDVELEEP